MTRITRTPGPVLDVLRSLVRLRETVALASDTELTQALQLGRDEVAAISARLVKAGSPAFLGKVVPPLSASV
jgi:hypothetical protein